MLFLIVKLSHRFSDRAVTIVPDNSDTSNPWRGEAPPPVVLSWAVYVYNEPSVSWETPCKMAVWAVERSFNRKPLYIYIRAYAIVYKGITAHRSERPKSQVKSRTSSRAIGWAVSVLDCSLMACTAHVYTIYWYEFSYKHNPLRKIVNFAWQRKVYLLYYNCDKESHQIEYVKNVSNISLSVACSIMRA